MSSENRLVLQYLQCQCKWYNQCQKNDPLNSGAIPSVNVNKNRLGYNSQNIGSNVGSGQNGSGAGQGSGGFSAPTSGGGNPFPPSPPHNPILNTILQNMGQLQQQLTNLSIMTNKSFLTHYCRSPLTMQLLNTPLPQGAESLKFERYSGDGGPYLHIDSLLTQCCEYHNLDCVA